MQDIERNFYMISKEFLADLDPSKYGYGYTGQGAPAYELPGKVCTWVACPEWTEEALDTQWWSAFHEDGIARPHVPQCDGTCEHPEGCYDQ